MPPSQKISMVAFEPDHWRFVYQWMTDPSYKKYFRNMPSVFTVAQMAAFPQMTGMNVLMFFDPELPQSCIGMATWDNVRIVQRSCEIGFLVDKNFQSSGYTRDAFLNFMKHLFHDLGFHKVTANVVDGDKVTTTRLDRAGFFKEGIMRDHALLDGKWVSEAKYSILDREFAEWYSKYERGEFTWAAENRVVA